MAESRDRQACPEHLKPYLLENKVIEFVLEYMANHNGNEPSFTTKNVEKQKVLEV